MSRSDWRVVQVNESHAIVFVEDLNNGRMSVTNDADAVFDMVQTVYPRHRVVYQDSDSSWWEICKSGTRITFEPWTNLVWDILKRN